MGPAYFRAGLIEQKSVNRISRRSVLIAKPRARARARFILGLLLGAIAREASDLRLGLLQKHDGPKSWPLRDQGIARRKTLIQKVVTSVKRV
jgi:hypothetical protein